MKDISYDSDGNITATAVKGITWTVQYSRKMGRENYGSEEAGVFAQIEVADDDDLATIESKVNATYAFVKTAVLTQLGVETVADGGVVRDVPANKPAAKPATKPAPRKTVTKANDKAPLWQDWIDNPDDWWDNRNDKRNPKAPDFKHKKSGEALWLSSAPEFAKLVLNGDAEVF